jgi:hypothetical protein
MPNKNAPKTSPRPQARMRREDEGSTRHPSGNLSDQGAMTAAEKRAERMRREDEGSTRHPSGKNINEQDTQFFMNGGMAKKKKMMMGGQANMTPMMNGGMPGQGYKDGGDVRRADVRDNPKRGKCY